MNCYTEKIPQTQRIDLLKDALFKEMPQIEADRAILLTESYKATENLPIIKRRSKAFKHILEHIPITIRDNELVVGSATKRPRSCQVFPEYSFEWLEDEFDTIEHRNAETFFISEETKAALHEVYKYWKGKTTSDLAASFMAPEAHRAIEHNMFTPGNYFYNGVGHVTVNYGEVLEFGLEGIRKKAEDALAKCTPETPDYATRNSFLEAVIESLDAAMLYAERYSELAYTEASRTSDPKRRE